MPAQNKTSKHLTPTSSNLKSFQIQPSNQQTCSNLELKIDLNLNPNHNLNLHLNLNHKIIPNLIFLQSIDTTPRIQHQNIFSNPNPNYSLTQQITSLYSAPQGLIREREDNILNIILQIIAPIVHKHNPTKPILPILNIPESHKSKRR